ncbi:MAG: hypothetical protein LBG17_04655 [Bacteroidales bacterium]|jgi:hypothetical protein|nr:hypothetical protein [Bacteroidales bacterium]
MNREEILERYIVDLSAEKLSLTANMEAVVAAIIAAAKKYKWDICAKGNPNGAAQCGVDFYILIEDEYRYLTLHALAYFLLSCAVQMGVPRDAAMNYEYAMSLYREFARKAHELKPNNHIK